MTQRPHPARSSRPGCAAQSRRHRRSPHPAGIQQRPPAGRKGQRRFAAARRRCGGGLPFTSGVLSPL
ncbi:hypothetical protein [Cedecea neteri]|uniref:hypothetical protein n=1 Tax=Cedecea neteri TaxID=158822 RepID=UPI0039083103